jgi:alkylation response protein AidB-like acyl-CoA dehydrogenase
MPLVLNEEQTLLRHSAEAFFREKSPVSALRALRDTRDETGFSLELWAEMAKLGWAGAFLPEQYGGIDCGFTELGVVMQAAGRTLAASPLFASIALGATAVWLAGNEAQKDAVLTAVASGDMLLALAYQEGPHHRPLEVSGTASVSDEGFVLNGCKMHVLDGHVADKFVVSLRTSAESGDTAGISLFLVDAATQGVSVARRIMADSRNMAEVSFTDVSVARAALLGTLDQGYPVLQQVMDRGNILLSAEMLGIAEAAFERTIDYLKMRHQFDQLIGSFQALQHRAAQMFCEIELSKSVVLKALESVDANAPDVALAASQAKVQVSETLRLVSDEAIQMHGGIGMTDEEDVGFYLKRARVAQLTLGDEHYHVQRYAQLRGY